MKIYSGDWEVVVVGLYRLDCEWFDGGECGRFCVVLRWLLECSVGKGDEDYGGVAMVRVEERRKNRRRN